MTIIVGTELTHVGVPGMKWGFRKGQKGFDTGRLSKVKAIGLGMYGNKSRFSDPIALQQRKTAGKLRIAALSVAMASKVTSVVGTNSHQEGLTILGKLLSAASTGLGVAGTVNATIAINKQQKADGNN